LVDYLLFVKKLIRKILRESYGVPDWFRDWESKSDEQRIASIEKRREQYIKMVPTMIKFFKEFYGEKLDRIEFSMDKGVYYAHESHTTKRVHLDFYFNEADDTTPREIKKYIESLFGIEMGYYGIPFDFDIFVKYWKRL